jgi:alpha-galactosidase
MTKIAFIGAGSHFGGTLARDILSLPELRDAHIDLCDIDQERLDGIIGYVDTLIKYHDLPAKVSGSVDRRNVLDGADFVVTSISAGGPAYDGFPANVEVNIPRKYGIEQSVADTIGVGGIFRFLRTAPVQLGICKDMEQLCPNALLLNYTNPMCMLTWLHSEGSRIKNVGLCHSVQGSIGDLSRYVDVPLDEISFLCAGINHQAWYLTFKRGHEDLYHRLRARLSDPEFVAKDSVRLEMYKHFGYYVTESTVHCSEYHPYFRRTKELREHYGLSERVVNESAPKPRTWNQGETPPDLTAGKEYASRIIQAMITDRPYRFNGNVMNTGVIPNLPTGSCVEVPCLVDAQGVQACHVGPLPTQLAALNLSNIVVQELAVRAALDRDREAAFHACAMDPLTRCVASLDQIRAMFDELWTAEGDLLAYFDE